MKCLVCGNEEKFTKLSPSLCSADNWLCAQCGLVFIPRGGGEKEDYYKEGGYYTSSPNLAARKFFTSRHQLLQIAKGQVKKIEKMWPIDWSNKKILDVGCGYGEMLGYLKLSHQCDVLGLEPSAETAKAGEKYFPIKIAASLCEDYEFGDDTFDFIMCNHALEHVDDPKKILNLLKSKLRPTGLLYLEVPNVMWPSNGFALNVFLYDEHIQTFSAYNLALLLKQCGFTILSYSDENFLRFVCAIKGASNKDLDVPEIRSQNIEKFLRNYKLKYSTLNHAQVYFGKFKYLIKLIYSKVIDQF